MAKVKPERRIQKYRSEDEMRAALTAFCAGSAQRSIPPQDDDTDIVLHDCIEELLEARTLLAEVRNFTTVLSAKFAQRK